MKKTEQSLRDMWDTIKLTNIFIMEILEGEERKKGAERLFEEIMAENFPNMIKDKEKSIWLHW